MTTTADHIPGDLVHLIDHLSTTTVNADNVKAWTSKDSTLSQVKRYTLLGWPDAPLGEEFEPYQSQAHELSVFNGCVLWGSHVVVPPQGRKAVLEELHETHSGVSRMKSLACSYICWPQMDSETETLVSTSCQESSPSPPAAPVHPGQRPWNIWIS